jgi:protein-disulfide isomerase
VKTPEGHMRLSGAIFLAMMQLCGFSNTTILIPSNHHQVGTEQEQDPAKQSGQNGDQKKTEPADENEKPRLIGINGGKIQLNMAQWPLVGSAKAKHVFVEMFDYTCPHCRQNHKYVKEAAAQFGDELAILAFSVPMNTDCNAAVQRTDPVHAEACEIARLSVAVWRVSPEKFGEFHEWLFSGTTAPSATQARIQAEKLVGKENFAKELAGNVSAQYVAKQVELYKMIGAGTVPKLLFTGTTVTGNIGATESLIKVIKQQPTDSQPKRLDVPQLGSKNGNDK